MGERLGAHVSGCVCVRVGGWVRERVGERVGKKQAGGGVGLRVKTRVGEGVGG